MNYRSVIDAAKMLQKELKAKFASEVTESRILVQFQNGTVYQYKTNPEGLVKLAKVNFNEVAMVQFAIGKSIKNGRFTKFLPKAIAMIEYKDLFVAPDRDVVSEGDFAWPEPF